MFLAIGFVAGIVVGDLLRETGLHWLAWPVIAVLAIGALLLQLPELRARLRKRS